MILYASFSLNGFSPPADDTKHIDQLLRTLNLNSPAPCVHPPPLSRNVDLSPTSPDFSPISTTSSLLTPTDLSPARSFDVKFNNTYDLGRSAPHLSQSSLLLVPSSPKEMHDAPSSNSSPYRQTYTLPSYQNTINTGPFFEQSFEGTFVYTSQPPRRPDPVRAPSMTWRTQQPSCHEWVRPNEKSFMENNCGLVTTEEPLRVPFVSQPNSHGTNTSIHAHEVCFSFSISFIGLI